MTSSVHDTSGKLLVVIPTLNEVATIGIAINGVLGQGADVLVVDDGSDDGTVELVESFTKANPTRVALLARDQKMGLGKAYCDGFAWGLAHGYGALGEMDADLSHNPDVVEAFLIGLEGFDVIIGSRYVPGGRTLHWPLSRHVLSRGAGIYVRMLTGIPVADPTAGFRAYRREVIETIGLDSIETNGYAFQVEMALKSWLAGYQILEVPIVFTERQYGVSKMSFAITKEAIIKVLTWIPLSLWGLRKQAANKVRYRRFVPTTNDNL